MYTLVNAAAAGAYMVHFRVVVDDSVHHHVIMFYVKQFMPDERFCAIALDNSMSSCAVRRMPFRSVYTCGVLLLGRTTTSPSASPTTRVEGVAYHQLFCANYIAHHVSDDTTHHDADHTPHPTRRCELLNAD